MYIGAIPTPAATESRQEFTATANQTVFSTTGGTVGFCDCFLNGVRMAASDFSFDGADVTLTSGAAAGDVLAVVMRQADNALVALPIKDSAGNNVLSESGGTVTLADTVQHLVPIVIAKRVNPQQSITTSTFTKIQFNTVEVDTHSFFDATTNYRFTPTISGYYHITTQAGLQSVGGTRFITDLYKNGSLHKRIIDSAQTTNASSEASHNASAIVQLNGSSDYVEIYVYVVSTNAIVIESGSNQTHFNAFLIQRT